MVFLDESGFMLTPNVKRTWSPRGKTPIVRHWFKQDKVSAIGAISVSVKRRRMGLYIRFRSKNILSRHIIQFLSHLLRHIQGHIILLWDGGTIHRSKAVSEFLNKHTRLHTERFPAYAPELNPVEYLWSQADSGLSNGAPDNVLTLVGKLRKTTSKIRSSQRLLRSCIHRSELKLL